MTIPLADPILDDEMVAAAEQSLREEYFLRGASVEAFEEEYADFVGTDHALAVSSGTAALHLSLEAMGIGEGDVVATTPATFIATANAIVRTGATVRFVDIDLERYTIDIDALAQLAAETSLDAVVPVHLYGHPAPIGALRDAADGAPVVADACQAHGAARGGEGVGAMADAAAFSFYPSKNMTVAGDGGMVTTDSDEVAELVRSLRDVGRGKGDEEAEHPRIGYTARLNTVNAAIGREQLDRLPAWNELRASVATRYDAAFADIEDLGLPPTAAEDGSGVAYDPAWYFYVVRSDRRAALAEHLEDHGIEAGRHYATPAHLHPPYRERGFERGDFPSAERWSETVLSLPTHPALSDTDVEQVIESIQEFFES